MSFSITLMQNTSPVNKIGKELSSQLEVTGELRSETSIIDPIIMIECDLADLTNCNYMYIPQFNRYYFVNNIRSIRNGLVEFTCHVDVLETYKDQIKANSAIIKRQENNWNLYLNDGAFKVYQNPIVITKEFPSGFSSQEFVLAVAGS